MPKIDSMQMLLVAELRDLLDAERRLTKALPKMAKKAESEELRQAITEHLDQTEEQVTRLEEALTALDVDPKAKTCHGMMGLLEEGTEHMEEDYTDDALRDAAIIASAQKVEHYEIAAYGTAATFARLIGNDHVASLLEATLQEEKDADQKLTQIAESFVNPEAEEEGEEEDDERETTGVMAARGRNSGSRGAGRSASGGGGRARGASGGSRSRR